MDPWTDLETNLEADLWKFVDTNIALSRKDWGVFKSLLRRRKRRKDFWIRSRLDVWWTLESLHSNVWPSFSCIPGATEIRKAWLEALAINCPAGTRITCDPLNSSPPWSVHLRVPLNTSPLAMVGKPRRSPSRSGVMHRFGPRVTIIFTTST